MHLDTLHTQAVSAEQRRGIGLLAVLLALVLAASTVTMPATGGDTRCLADRPAPLPCSAPTLFQKEHP